MGLFDDRDAYDEETFRDLAFQSGVCTEKSFFNCTFINCKLNEAVFKDCNFVDCSFKNCDLSLLRVPKTNFSNVKFDSSKLIGVNWSDARWDNKGLLKRNFFHFTNCVLNYSVFMGLKLAGITISKCTAIDVNFEETDLTKADCTGTDFSGSRFAHTNLSEADFTSATNYTIDIHANVLHKTKFSLPEAMALLRSLDIILVE